jgi:hypothetical protein
MTDKIRMYEFNCTGSFIIYDSGKIDTTDLFELNNIFGLLLDSNIKTMISFFLYKDKKCILRRALYKQAVYDKKYSGRKVLIGEGRGYESEYAEYSGRKSNFIVIQFSSGRFMSSPLTFKLESIRKNFLTKTPFISFDILKSNHESRRNDDYYVGSEILRSNPITEFTKITLFKQLFDLYSKYKSAPWHLEGRLKLDDDFYKLYNTLCIEYCRINFIPIFSENLQCFKYKDYPTEFFKLIQKVDSGNIYRSEEEQNELRQQKIESYRQQRGQVGYGKKKKSLSECTVKELRSKMKKRKIKCSKDGKKLTKSQMIQKLRK